MTFPLLYGLIKWKAKQDKAIKYIVKKNHGFSQVWQAVLLSMALWSHTAQSLCPRLRTDCPLWYVLSMLPRYMLRICRGLLVPPTSWNNQPVRESCPAAESLGDEEGLPSSSPHPLTSSTTWPKATRMFHTISRIYFILPCSLITFHAFATGVRPFHTVLPFWQQWYRIRLNSAGKQ